MNNYRLRASLIAAFLFLTAAALQAQPESCRDTALHRQLLKAMWDACSQADATKMEQAAADYQAHAISENDYNSYYNAWVCKIIHHLDRMDIYEAYNEVQGMKEDLRSKHPRTDEQFLVPNMLGQVYNACGNVHGAMQEFKKAVELIKGTSYEATGLSTLYLGLAHIYMNSRLSESVHWIDEDINELNRHTNEPTYHRGMANAYAFKAMLCFKLQQYDDFYKYQKLSDEQEALNQSGSSGSFRPYLAIYSEMLKGLRDKAHEDAGKLPNQKDHYIVWSDLLRYEGDFNEAFKVQRRLMHIRDSITGVMIAKNIEQTDKELSLVKAEQSATQRANIILTIAFVLTVLLIVAMTYYLYIKRKYQKALVQKNRELEEANSRVMAADNMKTEFIRNVSHEIRTPLNIINGFSQVITEPDATLNEEERSSIAGTISQNTRYITSLIDKMLALANESSKDVFSQITATDCLAVCKKAIADMPKYDQERITVTLDCDATEDSSLRTHADSLQQMLGCLLENAVKFTDEGSIKLVCRKTETGMRFAVEDTGCGISEENAQHIFERFTKIDTFKEGLGLGLAYCQETARKLGGDLVLDTRYKGGSRFVLTLPDL